MDEILEYFRYKDFEAYKIALTKPPQSAWLKSRELGGGKKSSYQPIEVTEALADMVFRDWFVTDEKYMNVLNEVVCTVKITALPDYPGADYVTFTGSASKPVQAASGSKAEEFPKGKLANALQYCLPAVRSDAIGCAFETLGNLFGRNVNRGASNDFGFSVEYKKPKTDGAV
jgi:hypothetical protein